MARHNVPPATWFRCNDCERRLSARHPLPASVPCTCGAAWLVKRSRKHGSTGITVERDTPGDMLSHEATQAQADTMGERITGVMAQQRKARALTAELYRRYLRDCAANGLTPTEEADA